MELVADTVAGDNAGFGLEGETQPILTCLENFCRVIFLDLGDFGRNFWGDWFVRACRLPRLTFWGGKMWGSVKMGSIF